MFRTDQNDITSLQFIDVSERLTVSCSVSGKGEISGLTRLGDTRIAADSRRKCFGIDSIHDWHPSDTNFWNVEEC